MNDPEQYALGKSKELAMLPVIFFSLFCMVVL
jgi:hypothetical protein